MPRVRRAIPRSRDWFHSLQRVEPDEVKTAPVNNTTEDVEEAKDKKPAAEQAQKTKLLGHIVSREEANLFARKAGDNNEALDENPSQQWGGTGSIAQEAIIITSQSPVANKNKERALGDKRRADVYLPNEQIKDVSEGHSAVWRMC